jgi:hypothetical protein
VTPLAWIVRDENGMLSVMERDRFTEAYEPLNAVQASPDLEELASLVDGLLYLLTEEQRGDLITTACALLRRLGEYEFELAPIEEGSVAPVVFPESGVLTSFPEETDGSRDPDVVQETEGS